MKIKHIKIRNYRSISNLELDLSSRINAFIGANNVGKSNILSALEWITGDSYPTPNRLERWDFYNGDEDAPLDIELTFDDGKTLAFNSTWIDPYGREKHGLNLDKGYINDEQRAQYVSASIGPDRRIAVNPATNQWSLLGRMLKEFNNRLYEETIVEDGHCSRTKADVFKEKMEQIRDEILFSIQDDCGNPLMSEFASILQDETTRQLNCSPNDLSIDLNIYDPWNLFRTLQIFIEEHGSGIQMRASDMGMGVQASLTIAILKAYSQLKLHNQTPVFIDEPELYLHPQARRQFYRAIEDLADSGTQVFLTTHSTEFVDIGHFNQIYIVRKSLNRGTYVRTAQPDNFIVDLEQRTGIQTSNEDLMLTYQNAFENTGDSQRAAEALFASTILLVEGESESLIVPYLFDQIKYDYISKGLSIVRCGGKNELDRFYRLYAEFGIPCYVLFDGDCQNKGTDDELHTIKANKSILTLFGEQGDFPDGRVHESYLGFTKRLEDSLQIGEIGNQVKGIRLFIRLRDAIRGGSEIPKWVRLIASRIDMLPDEVASILQVHPYKEDDIYEFNDLPF